MADNLLLAHETCGALARNHYENFPVASWLLPAALRGPVAAIYAFARTADDIADEGQLDPSSRTARLRDYGAHLDAIENGGIAASGAPPEFVAIADAVRRYRLPTGLFRDLLSAFAQDIDKTRYADRRELLDYCRRSANPIGRLLLRLTGFENGANVACSDAICSALQLINFLQDVQVDHEKGRIYLPQDEMARFGVTEEHIARARFDAAWQGLIEHQLDHAEALMRAGRPLLGALRGRFALEIRATWAGGWTVLRKLRARNRQGFIGGQRLGVTDWFKIAVSVLRPTTP